MFFYYPTFCRAHAHLKCARGSAQKHEKTSAHAQENSVTIITEVSKRESPSHKRSEAFTYA